MAHQSNIYHKQNNLLNPKSILILVRCLKQVIMFLLKTNTRISNRSTEVIGTILKILLLFNSRDSHKKGLYSRVVEPVLIS